MNDRHGHVADAQPTIDRIGAALDRIGFAGWPAVDQALAGYTRERRGRLRSNELPFDVARDLLRLADEAERLALVLEEANTDDGETDAEYRARIGEGDVR
jgi:hypothetical protein